MLSVLRQQQLPQDWQQRGGNAETINDGWHSDPLFAQSISVGANEEEGQLDSHFAPAQGSEPRWRMCTLQPERTGL